MGNTWTALSAKITGAPATPHKVLFTGLWSAGKTTLMYKLGTTEPRTTIPTIGFNVKEVTMEGMHMMSWDLGGRSPMRPLMRHYYPILSGIVFVVDGCDKQMIGWGNDELRKLLAEEQLLGMPLLVAVNKTDLPHAMTLVEVSEKLGLPTVVQERGPRSYRVIGCSVQDLGGLKEGLAWLQKEMSATKPRVAAQQIKDTKTSPVSSGASPTATKTVDRTTSIADSTGATDTLALDSRDTIDGDDAETVLSAEEAEAPPPRGKPLGGAGEGMVEDPTLVSAISDERLFSSGGIATN